MIAPREFIIFGQPSRRQPGRQARPQTRLRVPGRPGRGHGQLLDPHARLGAQLALGRLLHPHQGLPQFAKHIHPVIPVLNPAHHPVHLRPRLLHFAVGRLELPFLLLQRRDILFHVGQHLPLHGGQFVKQEPHRRHHRHQAAHRRQQIRLLLVETLPAQRARRHQIQLHRAARQVAQPQPHHLAQRMRHPRQFLEVEPRIQLDVAQRVEILHRHIQLLGEKLRRIRHHRRPARQKQPLRRRAALLAAVKLHGLVDLDMQPRHKLPGNLGDRRLVRVIRLLIRPAQAHKPLVNLELLRRVKLQLRLIGKILRDGVRPQVDAARENLALLKKQQVAGLGANIQQHRAILQVAIIIAKRIAQRRRRNIRQLQLQPRRLRHPEQPLHHVRLDGHQHHLQLPPGRRPENLVIPHHLGQRKRHILLRLILDHLRHLARLHRRQLDELGKHVEPRGADIDLPGLDPLLGQDLLQRLENHRLAGAFLRPLRAQRLEAVLLQPQPARLVDLELGQLETARAKINR
ncbi:MAG: hypothetical protein BWX68_00241 [Verrucomicrobia bacterium ADurb.Bin063]|nr:MAG: hypothetical protein BWX68_00241 [Verrucomicrobia bacterium ADurb.Bin063]